MDTLTKCSLNMGALQHVGLPGAQGASKAIGDTRCFSTRNATDYGLSLWPQECMLVCVRERERESETERERGGAKSHETHASLGTSHIHTRLQKL